jgi:exonuclease SbcC
MLCGATDHPFVTNYHTVAVSETEAKLQQRKAELQKLTTLLRNLELDAATKQTRLDAEIGQQAELVRKSEKCRADFKALSIGFQIEAPILIQAELALKRTALAACKEQILQQQKLQLAKDKAQQSLQNATETVATLRTEAKLLQEKSTNLAAQLDQLRTETQQLTQELQTKEVALQQDFGVFQFALPKPDETTEFLKLRKTEIENFHKAEQKINDLQHKIDKVSLERTHLEASVQQKNGELIATNNDLLTLHAIIDTALIKREALLPNQISTDSKRSELHSKLQQYAGVLSQTKSTWDASHKQHTEHSTKLELLRIDIEQLTPKLHAAWQQLQAEYMPTQFTTVQEVIAAILPQTVLVSHLGIFQKLHETRLSLKTRLTQLTQKRAELLCSKDFECAQSEAEQTAETQKSEKARIHTRQGELNHKLQLDAEIKRRNQGIVAEIELQDAHHSLWKTLLELLGGTKDSFNKYVQRLTLHNLIQLANIHLAKLNRRYSLYMPSMSKGGEELNFVLVDHYQTDQCRSIETSSGGEKFLISLALALGLSDLASKNVHIGSLFIDEGFGTLDQQTLQTVITTLETLQASGKMIGVISHVENMKERIGTQIQILKKSNGVSELKIV